MTKKQSAVEVIAYAVSTFTASCPECTRENEFQPWNLPDDETLTCKCGTRLKIVGYGY